jgi:hypothetical protein
MTTTIETAETGATDKKSKPVWVKLWPLYVIIAGLFLAISQGWHTHLTPQALGENAVYLDNLVKDNFLLVLLACTFLALCLPAYWRNNRRMYVIHGRKNFYRRNPQRDCRAIYWKNGKRL